MDNKITKRRLYDFLAYEWIAIIAVIVAAIIGWNLIFTMTSVKLNVGQDFKFFYDETIDYGSGNDIYNLFTKEDNPERTIFSYDVLKLSHEVLNAEYNVLKERLSVQEGDVIITDCSQPKDSNGSVRAVDIINSLPVCDYQTLKEDAEDYLAQLLKDSLKSQYAQDRESVDVTDFDNLDSAKIEAMFRERMKKDNRYRKESQKQEGIALEKERIKDLCLEVKKFKHLLNAGDEYFFNYEYVSEYQENKGIRPYGLKVEMLSGGEGKDLPSKFFKKTDADDAKDIVILVFDLIQYQPHLQFESIAFINAIVDGCSNLYDGF